MTVPLTSVDLHRETKLGTGSLGTDRYQATLELRSQSEYDRWLSRIDRRRNELRGPEIALVVGGNCLRDGKSRKIYQKARMNYHAKDMKDDSPQKVEGVEEPRVEMKVALGCRIRLSITVIQVRRLIEVLMEVKSRCQRWKKEK